MKFGISQKTRFESRSGTYSIVTQREHHDSQITATDSEAELLNSFFGDGNIQVGNVKSNPDKACKTFLLYPSGQAIQLNLVFPKPQKPELRLYLKKDVFKPESDEIWFLFEKENMLWIGSMNEDSWRDQSRILVYDPDDFAFQDSLQDLDKQKVPILPEFRTKQETTAIQRSRSVALESIRSAGHQCEFDHSHQTFTARSSSRPYVEAHHLIPVSAQKHFQATLDTSENIFSLCPNCHRAIHYGEQKITRTIIDRLLEIRSSIRPLLDSESLEYSDIYSFYAIEKIQ